MRVISRKRLSDFREEHESAKKPLLVWFDIVLKAIWKNSSDVPKTFRTVDQPVINGKKIAIFNIGGNKFRLIAAIHFNTEKVFIRSVLTHSEYDAGKWKDRI